MSDAKITIEELERILDAPAGVYKLVEISPSGEIRAITHEEHDRAKLLQGARAALRLAAEMTGVRSPRAVYLSELEVAAGIDDAKLLALLDAHL